MLPELHHSPEQWQRRPFCAQLPGGITGDRAPSPCPTCRNSSPTPYPHDEHEHTLAPERADLEKSSTSADTSATNGHRAHQTAILPISNARSTSTAAGSVATAARLAARRSAASESSSSSAPSSSLSSQPVSTALPGNAASKSSLTCTPRRQVQSVARHSVWL